MSGPIVVLSGHICSGKSTLADDLANTFGLKVFRTYDALKDRADKKGISSDQRRAMQDFGEKLDGTTRGAWVAEDLGRMLDNENDQDAIHQGIVIDCVRISKQIDAIRNGFSSRRVVHVHLQANHQLLAKRYKSRKGRRLKELKDFKATLENKTEKAIDSLAAGADLVLDTSRCVPSDVLVRVASQLGLYGRGYERCVDVMVGGQYGSEGKGHIASFLAREYDVLVRVGGPNAGHTVYRSSGKVTYHHLPSGTQHNPKAQLIIGPGATIHVATLQEELAASQIDAKRLSIDPQAMIITDQDKKKEAKLQKAIGSTGQGVGSATSRRIMGRSSASVKLARDIKPLRPFIRETRAQLDYFFRNGDRVFLEGTQGTGLSLFHGFYPHVTSRDTTVAGCLAEAGISSNRVRRVIMVCRTYPIRVQSPLDSTSGHMSLEIDWKEVSRRSKISTKELAKCERTSTTNRERRVCEFDWDLLRKAASLNAPTDVALSFVDYIDIKNRNARRFDQLTPNTIHFIEEIERVARAPVSLISTRFHTRSILDRRIW